MSQLLTTHKIDINDTAAVMAALKDEIMWRLICARAKQIQQENGYVEKKIVLPSRKQAFLILAGIDSPFMGSAMDVSDMLIQSFNRTIKYKNITPGTVVNESEKLRKDIAEKVVIDMCGIKFVEIYKLNN